MFVLRPLNLRVDSGPAFRDKFSETMGKMGVKVQHSIGYSPQSNSMGEHFVHTTKHLLQKNGRMNQLELDELILCGNAQVQPDGQASALDRFLGRSVMTNILNSLDSSYNWQESIKRRHQIREKRVLKLQRGNKDKFDLGERCMLQCLVTKKKNTGATVVGIRVAPDQKILSYDLITDSKKSTTPAPAVHAKIIQDLPISVNNEGDDSADDNPKVSADDDFIVFQAAGMPINKQWTRGDRLRPSRMKCQQVRCTSDSLPANGKSWGASREQLTKAALGEQARTSSLQSLCHILSQLHSLATSSPEGIF